MDSSRLEPDEEVSLMIAVLSNLKIKHRVIFEGEKRQGVTQLLYRCRLEVRVEDPVPGWFHAESLEKMLAWLAQGK